jgi:isochorismate synthase/2-succinyl-5-enolpyruvyl-6-hydroxy-3-cyclohexene-1-carboxylate synthase/2-succinyl-6-hydroxy-2,4-cyclohexadiene-1-carboxylate synthase/O-succinylbenzoate synthase
MESNPGQDMQENSGVKVLVSDLTSQALSSDGHCVCKVITLPPQISLTEGIETLRQALITIPLEHSAKTSTRGLVRLEVPVPRTTTALRWLGGQSRSTSHRNELSVAVNYPQVYFSPRRSSAPDTPGSVAAASATSGTGSIAGVGCAWMWQGRDGQRPDERVFSSIRRFMNPNNSQIRAFGGCRFDPETVPSEEWSEFGSYFFLIPRIEYVEGWGSNLLAVTVAWDQDQNEECFMQDCFSNVETATAEALKSLLSLRPPAVDQAINPGASCKVLKETHVPRPSEWQARMTAVHSHLVPITPKTNAWSGHSKSPDPDAALEEYLRNGQAGLDGLLAALDRGFDDYMMAEEGDIPSNHRRTLPSEYEDEDADSSGFDGPRSPPPSMYDHQDTDAALSKVVLARRTDVTGSGELHPWILLESLQERDPRAYQTLITLPSGTSFISSTPECLYRRTERNVASEAVAGTRARGAGGDVEKDFWLAFDMLRSHKDDVEFGVVRDWVRRALSTVCEDVKVEVTKSVLKQGSVQHLYGKLAGTLRPGLDDASLLECLHPTPAVCGQPRGRALEVLAGAEGFDRGLYAGPCGWVSGNAAEFVVAIRSALIRGESAEQDCDWIASLFAGVGIVSGSDKTLEWSELDLKISPYKRLLSCPLPLSHTPNIAALWARMAVEELCRLGCNTFCIAPGSRSSPLTLAIAAHPRARIVPCIDERSLGFWALGHGRATGKPAVVITSSGTAVANLLPAVVEASQSRVPLVLLTADRPQEVRNTGANQTIDQVSIFGRSYLRWESDVQPPTDSVPARTLLTTIDHALHRAVDRAAPPGPVHINCQFREPLAPIEVPWNKASSLEGLERWEAGSEPFTGLIQSPTMREAFIAEIGNLNRMNSYSTGQSSTLQGSLIDVCRHTTRGLLVVGQLDGSEDVAAVLSIARSLGWPIVADVLSGLRIGAQHHSCHAATPSTAMVVMSHFDHVLLGDQESCWPVLVPQVILQFGGYITSKRIVQFMEWSCLHENAKWIFWDQSPQRHDQCHALTHRVQAPPSLLASILSTQQSVPYTSPDNCSSYRELMANIDAIAGRAIDQAIDKLSETQLTEPAIARTISRLLPPGEGLFVGNSMPIRDFDMYACCAPSTLVDALPDKGFNIPLPGKRMPWIGAPIAANRGASGIDGVLSTAAGFADGLNTGCTLVVGDVSFLHDINGLNLLRSGEMRPPLTVVLINNGGGSIFSFLPIARHVSEDVFGPLWTTPQHVDLGGMCRAQGIPHVQVGTLDELKTALVSSWHMNRHTVVEVVIQGGKVAVEGHQAIQNAVRTVITQALKSAGGNGTDPRVHNGGSENGLQNQGLQIVGARVETFCMPVCQPLTVPASTSTASFAREREGAYVCLDVEGVRGGKVIKVTGVGEVSPLAGVHEEGLREAIAQAAFVCHCLQGKILPTVGLGSRNSAKVLEDWMRSVQATGPSLLPSVRFGVEGAILSAVAQHLEVGLPSLLSSLVASKRDGRSHDIKREIIRTETRINGLVDAQKGESIQIISQRAKELVDSQGYRCLKLKVARPWSSVEWDTQMVKAVQKAVGLDVILRVDANSSWTLQEAMKFAETMKASEGEVNLQYVEDPVRTITDLTALCKQTDLPIALDEPLTAAKWQPGVIDFISKRSNAKALKALALKPAAVGSMLLCLRLAELGNRLGIKSVITSAFESSVGLVQLEALARAVDPAGEMDHGLSTGAWLDDALPKGVEGIVKGSETHLPPIIFLHGFLGHASEWEAIMVGLSSATGRRCIAVDLPAHGATSDVLEVCGLNRINRRTGDSFSLNKKQKDGIWCLESTAAELASLLESQGIKKASVVGYSLGARLALLLASSRPDLVENVVAISGSAGLHDEEAREARRRADDKAAQALKDEGVATFVQRWYTAPMWTSFKRHPVFESVVESRIKALEESGDIDALASALAGWSPGRAPYVLDRLAHAWGGDDSQHSLFLIVGSLDAKYVAIAEEMSASLLENKCYKNSKSFVKVEVFKGCGHAVHVEDPLALLTALVRFFSS